MMWGNGPFSHGYYGGGWGIVGMILMALFWIAVIVIIVLVVRALARGGWGGNAYQVGPPRAPEERGSPALRILEERYARGEIDQEEFQRRKADLTS